MTEKAAFKMTRETWMPRLARASERELLRQRLPNKLIDEFFKNRPIDFEDDIRLNHFAAACSVTFGGLCVRLAEWGAWE